MFSERINPFNLNIYLNIGSLPPLTILFQENIYIEHVQLGAGLQGACNPPPFSTVGWEKFLTAS